MTCREATGWLWFNGPCATDDPDGHGSLVNMTIHNVADAKTHLSQLLDAALKGEDVILARAGKPLVRLVPLTAPAARALGFLDLPTPDERFDPLSAADLAAWS